MPRLDNLLVKAVAIKNNVRPVVVQYLARAALSGRQYSNYLRAFGRHNGEAGQEDNGLLPRARRGWGQ